MRNLRRSAKRGLLVALVAVVTLGIAWVGAHVIGAEPRPAPLVGASDFGVLPPAEDNGFDLMAHTTLKVRPVPGTLPSLSRPRGGTEALTWEQAQAASRAVKIYLEDEDTKSALRVLDTALARPAFVDACGDRFDAGCRVFPIYAVVRARSYEILDLALEGKNEEASRALAQLLRAQLSWLVTARSVVSAKIALAASRSAVGLSALLGPRLSSEQRASLAPAVSAFASTPFDLPRMVKLAYLEDLAAIDYVVTTSSGWHPSSPTSPASPPTLSERFVSQRLFDRGRTERELAERTRQTLRWAEKGDVPLPLATEHGRSPFFWAYNPVGKMLLDVQLSPQVWETTRDEGRALVKEAAAVDLR